MVAYSFKDRFVWPFKVGLGLAVPDSFDSPKPKRQTIRAYGKRRHAREGETLQLYTAMRTKQCKKIADVRCTEVLPIKIEIGNGLFTVRLSGRLLPHQAVTALALSDGFSSTADMHQFWTVSHGDGLFEGVLIRWEPLT